MVGGLRGLRRDLPGERRSAGAEAPHAFGRVAAAAGVSLAALLAFKQGLHDFLSELTWPEIRSALLILVAAFVVLPLLPAGAIDPCGLIEPQTLLLLTIVLAVASFGGYLALRVLGARSGVIASALLGGLVSSTAVTFDLAGRVRRRELDASTAAAGASLAAASSAAAGARRLAGRAPPPKAPCGLAAGVTTTSPGCAGGVGTGPGSSGCGERLSCTCVPE